MTDGFGRRRWRRRFELPTIVVILGLFVALVLTRLPHYEAAAEETYLEANITALRAGLSQAVLLDQIHGNSRALAKMAGTNPVDLAMSPPGGYIGVHPGLTPAKARPGTWYFDPRKGILVYRVRSDSAFTSSLGPPPRVELKIVTAPGGVPRLISVAPYQFRH